MNKPNEILTGLSDFASSDLVSTVSVEIVLVEYDIRNVFTCFEYYSVIRENPHVQITDLNS